MRSFVAWLALAALCVACGDDDSSPTPDAGPMPMEDAGPTEDTGPPDEIEDLPIDETRAMPGLMQSVDAVRDERGMWHIYASNLEDAMLAQGYLQAQDRMGQMEFIRRQATGRLAEYAGSLDSSLFDADVDARFEGYSRLAAEILPTLTDEERTLAEKYAEGVNAYIQRIRDGEAFLPRGVDLVTLPEQLTDWTVIETLAIARFQAAALSFDGNDDINRTDALVRWQEYFPDDAEDERIARLAGAHHDLFTFLQAREVYTIDGFPNLGTDSGSRAFDPRGPIARVPMRLPSRDVLEAAKERLDRIERGFHTVFGDGHRGSNSWVVHGDHTASGNSILSNDPHLSLTSPPLFWQAHVNTKRAGGNVDVAGQMIAGTPAIILGFTDQLAWGLTTHGYDVTDVYLETITPVEDGPDTVLFEGEQVAIETITETITFDSGREEEVTFELVPHHGLIIPETRTETEAISIRWTGNEPSNEPGAFFDLYEAENVAEAREAFQKFEVGGQTLVVVDRAGDIFYTSSANIPVRDERAVTYDPSTYEGVSPCFVLDGSGEHEWTGRLDDRFIPHDQNPDKGFIATANSDAVGVTEDGNPHNDAHFLGCSFENGHRLARIDERLRELVDRGNITPEDMSELQNDALSPLGRGLTPTIVAALDRALEERDTPGTHADLEDAVDAIGDAMDDVAAARDRLMAWEFDTPAAVEGSPDADTIAESVAASIFNVTYGHLMRLTLDDELDWHGNGMLDGSPRRSSAVATAMYLMVNDPTRLVSFSEDYDPDGDGVGDSVFWDDLATEEEESKDERILRAVAAALEWLGERFESTEMEDWRWGQLHTLQLDAIVPVSLIGMDPLSIPTPDDEMFPNGFPRHGDRDVVDASNFGDFNFEQIDYGSGPQQRLVVEMTPEGPVAVNAFPGGNSEDPDSQFHRNEMELWRMNEVAPVPFTEAEVLDAAVSRVRFDPE